MKVFDGCACVIIKHANPCGVGIAADTLAAYEKAFATDPTSAFGGIIAFNEALDESNSDQSLSFLLEQEEAIADFVRKNKADGAIPYFLSDSPKHSYSRINFN